MQQFVFILKTFKDWFILSLVLMLVVSITASLIIPFAIFVVPVYFIIVILLISMTYFLSYLPFRFKEQFEISPNSLYSGIAQSLIVNFTVIALFPVTIFTEILDKGSLFFMFGMVQFLYWIPIVIIKVLKAELETVQGIVIGIILTAFVSMFLFMATSLIDSIIFHKSIM